MFNDGSSIDPLLSDATIAVPVTVLVTLVIMLVNASIGQSRGSEENELDIWSVEVATVSVQQRVPCILWSRLFAMPRLLSSRGTVYNLQSTACRLYLRAFVFVNLVEL